MVQQRSHSNDHRNVLSQEGVRMKPLSNHKDELERRELRDMVMQLHETVASNNQLVLGEMAQIY